jgi:hypothetical protein
LPESCYAAWRWFTDLHNARSTNGFSINPISYSDMKAYFDLFDIVPEVWELELIKKFDSEIIASFAKQEKTKK